MYLHYITFCFPDLACQWPAGYPQSYGRPSAGKHNISALPPSHVSSDWFLCRPWPNTWQSCRSAPPPVWHTGYHWMDGEPGRWEWSYSGRMKYSTLFWSNYEDKCAAESYCMFCKQFIVFQTCHSLWDLSKSFNRLSCSGVLLDVFSCCVLHLTFLHSKKYFNVFSISEDLYTWWSWI